MLIILLFRLFLCFVIIGIHYKSRLGEPYILISKFNYSKILCAIKCIYNNSLKDTNISIHNYFFLLNLSLTNIIRLVDVEKERIDLSKDLSLKHLKLDSI